MVKKCLKPRGGCLKVQDGLVLLCWLTEKWLLEADYCFHLVNMFHLLLKNFTVFCPAEFISPDFFENRSKKEKVLQMDSCV